uniref:Uncharacterized protein n=1 Tax=Theileria annulata TaxID=5874 RepID=A0A3B0N4L8_THEAN
MCFDLFRDSSEDTEPIVLVVPLGLFLPLQIPRLIFWKNTAMIATQDKPENTHRYFIIISNSYFRFIFRVFSCNFQLSKSQFSINLISENFPQKNSSLLIQFMSYN